MTSFAFGDIEPTIGSASQIDFDYTVSLQDSDGMTLYRLFIFD
jgi:hypothetical protein